MKEKRQVVNRTNDHQQAAVQINELAGRLQSLDDSRMLVDTVAAMFEKNLPRRLRSSSLRIQIAQAEYASATNSEALIPEERIVEAWNSFVRRFGGPAEALVTEAEPHNLRDAHYASAQFFWARESQSVWTMPHLYAVGADGKVANGCRATEALREIWDFANVFENLRGARERVEKGIVLSDHIRQPSGPSSPREGKCYLAARVAPPHPLKIAWNRYRHEHGVRSLTRRVEELVDGLFPR